MTLAVDTFAERLAALRARIDRVAEGRAVEIVAVTKGFDAAAVDAAVAAGITAIGENYAQELLAKAALHPGGSATRWHFIGTIQRNKVPALAPHVAVWQTVDRSAVADAIARHAPGAAVLVQANLTDVQERGGCRFDDIGDVVAGARAAGLDVRGLMGVAPVDEPAAVRERFAALAAEGRRLGLAELSIGMSDDFEIAVEEGSTMVRVGTALFGPRPRHDEVRR